MNLQPKLNQLILLMTLFSLLIAAGPVAAESPSSSGFYVGAGASYLVEVFDALKRANEPFTDFFSSTTGTEPVTAQFDDGLGANIKAGYRVHPHFALELDVLIATGFTADTPDKTFITVQGTPSLTAPGRGQDLRQSGDSDFDGIAYTANAKGYLLTGMVQPYLNIGVGVLDGDLDGSSRTDFILRPGAGINAYVTDHILAYVEASYLWGFGEVDQFDTIPITIGIQYRF